jgi:hypothetical protein
MSAPRSDQEQVFFSDPAVDRMLGVLMTLATEHYVLRDRVRALEEQLARSGVVDRSRLSAVPGAGEAEEIAADAAEFAATLMESLLGAQRSTGLPGRFTLRDLKGPHP